ncbi:MAG: hypothetical protein AAF443_00145 [Chlamydiota bacterium]
MITGAGKSKAANLSISSCREGDLARDSVAIVRKGLDLFGSYDTGAIQKDPEKRKSINGLHKIDFIAYCLPEDETKDLFQNESPKIVAASNRFLITLSLAYNPIYPAVEARRFFSGEQLFRLQDTKRRFDRFLELTNNTSSIKFLIVPWMETLEAKASLYSEFDPSTLKSFTPK